MKAIIIRIIKQMKNDKRSLALILLVPILIMTFMYFIYGDLSYVPKITLQNVPSNIEMVLSEQNLEIVSINDDANELLEGKSIDALLYMDVEGMHLKMLELNSMKVSLITKEITKALNQLNPTGQGLQVEYLYGDMYGSTFDSLGYIILGILSFFFVFLIAGVSFVRERTLGTMERFMLSPISRSQVVMGFLLGFGFFAIIQSVMLVFFVKYVLGLAVVGSLIGVIIIMMLLAFVAVALGSLVSTFANNEFQVAQFIPVIVVPQMFFSGLIPIELLPFGLGPVAYVMPVFYACDALNTLMVKGGGVKDILPQAGVLIFLVAVLFFANTLLLKKYRTI
ncbi:MAG: ABC transporter permease [Candidatus Izemoplasmatales bacterium]|jgi:ABC-2 type transport system permease protein|nr:ABC transporter permease [Candidatus Izemoplasmatales bacterium]